MGVTNRAYDLSKEDSNADQGDEQPEKHTSMPGQRVAYLM